MQPRPQKPSDPSKLPALPEVENHERKHEEIRKNPSSLKDTNTLINFVNSLPGANAYKGSQRVGGNNKFLLGTGELSQRNYSYDVSVTYSDTHGKKVVVVIPHLGAKEQVILLDILKVFYPTSFDQVYSDAISASKRQTISLQKTYEGRSITFWSTGIENDIELWIGAE